MFLIYSISGIGGNFVAGIFAANQVAMGADPAVYGLLGVQVRERERARSHCTQTHCAHARAEQLLRAVGIPTFH